MQHPKLVELLERTKGIVGMGTIIRTTLQQVLGQQSKIHTVYYTLEQAESKTNEKGERVFYSCSIVIITSQAYISLGFFPKFHRVEMFNIATISSFVTEFRSPSKDELKLIPDIEFIPESIWMKVQFSDRWGKETAVWEVDTAGKGYSNELLACIKELTPLVGQNLGY